jgi:hypothetical protein
MIVREEVLVDVCRGIQLCYDQTGEPGATLAAVHRAAPVTHTQIKEHA